MGSVGAMAGLWQIVHASTPTQQQQQKQRQLLQSPIAQSWQLQSAAVQSPDHPQRVGVLRHSGTSTASAAVTVIAAAAAATVASPSPALAAAPTAAPLLLAAVATLAASPTVTPKPQPTAATAATATASAPAAASNQSSRNGVLVVSIASTADACCARCASHDNCGAWSWEHESHRCELQDGCNSMAAVAPQHTHTSGCCGVFGC